MLSEAELKLEARSPYSDAPVFTFSFCMNHSCSFPASPSVCKAISGGAAFPCLLECDAGGHVGSLWELVSRAALQGFAPLLLTHASQTLRLLLLFLNFLKWKYS